MVPLVKASLETPPRMQGSWSNNDSRMPEDVVESSKRVDSGLGPSIEGFPQYYHRQGH
jgi:hypothetical protein